MRRVNEIYPADGYITCHSCFLIKLNNEFPDRSSGGIFKKSTQCKGCHKLRRRADKLNNKASNRETIYNYLLSHPCVDCGETNPIVLTFDHFKNKRRAVADMICEGYSEIAVKLEIEKCEVRCASCHMLKTARDLNYWIYFRHYGES